MTNEQRIILQKMNSKKSFTISKQDNLELSEAGFINKEGSITVLGRKQLIKGK